MPTSLAVDAELVARLRMTIGRLHRRLRLATNDIPPLQYSTLVTLERHGPQRSGELAQREAVAAPTMTRVLAALVERGFVNRAPDPCDARSIRVSISELGLAAVNRVRRERTALLGARLERLAPEQRIALADALPALEALASDD